MLASCLVNFFQRVPVEVIMHNRALVINRKFDFRKRLGLPQVVREAAPCASRPAIPKTSFMNDIVVDEDKNDDKVMIKLEILYR